MFLFRSPFDVHRIPNSNLLLVVVNKMEDLENPPDILTTDPQEMVTGVQYGSEHPCHKIYMNNLPRRRLDECFVSFPPRSFHRRVTTSIFAFHRPRTRKRTRHTSAAPSRVALSSLCCCSSCPRFISWDSTEKLTQKTFN